ncbi:MAG TPA: fused MFS/spermidine synthase, partial [Pirellulaceae bacterium]|nr:fused MFS/spermidine synthase [Pirellulaceae bacterium]
KVLMVAQKYFTYLSKSPAKPEVVMGDARISLEREPDQNYDVIHLDAFSGDAIPAHLLTDEAFGLYERHLRHEERIDEKTGKKIQVPIGIVVVHISNRYLDLEPVVAAIARKHEYDTLSVHKTEEGGPTDTASDWILVTKNKDFLNKLRNKGIGEPLKPAKEILWTDQFTALFPIMK